jgi:hypothetical protein
VTIDPYPSLADATGEPYANALEIDPEELLTGDVELPYVTSAVDVVSGKITATMQGGQVVTLGPGRTPVRIVSINQISDGVMPDRILALW